MARSKKRPDRHKHKTVSFRLPEQLMEEVRALAGRNRRTLSGEVQVALERHLLRSNGQAELSDPPAHDTA